MAESTKGVLEFLEQLKRDRDELNGLIAGIEKRLGLTPSSTSNNAPTGQQHGSPKVKVSMGDIPVGFFHNLSQPAAAEKLLLLNPGQALTTPEILDAFRRSGMHLNPKNAATILYTALTRNPKFERVAGKAWGLSDWYPESKKRQRGTEVEPDAAMAE